MRVGLKYSSADATGSKHIIWRSGQYLILTTRDSNNRLLPIACAIVASEDKDSYRYFVKHLKLWGADKYLNVPDHAIVTDRCKGLEELHRAFEHANHLNCFKHIIPNCKQSAGKTKDSYAWAMQKAETEAEYKEKLNSMRNFNPRAADYLDALVHDQTYFYAYNRKGVRTYGHKTNNVAEIVNGVHKKLRGEHPLWFLHGFTSWIGEKMQIRSDVMKDWIRSGHVLTPYATNEFMKQVYPIILTMPHAMPHTLPHGMTHTMPHAMPHAMSLALSDTA